MSGMSIFLLLPFLCVFGSPWSLTGTQGQRMPELVHANFVQHEFHSLNVSNVTASRLVRNEFDCLFACLKTSPCLLINVAVSPDVNKKVKCDLLATHKYSSPEKFQKSSQVHHYSKYSDCEKNPCLNNGTCLPMYEENDYKCECIKLYWGKHCELSTGDIRHCADAYAAGLITSGVYKIQPDELGPFDVFCDHATAGGGWTVFQKRFNGSVDFYRGWDEYKKGFGDLNGEFWLGLDKIYRLTSQKQNKLRVDLQDKDDNTAYAEYDLFTIENEAFKYRLNLGQYSGTAGDSLKKVHNQMAFSTYDRDNDLGSRENCATHWKGAWWYKHCHHANLNGLYQPGVHHASGMTRKNWTNIYIGLKGSQMKVRPTSP